MGCLMAEVPKMDVMLLLCLAAALAGAGCGWYSMARKESETIGKRLLDGRTES